MSRFHTFKPSEQTALYLALVNLTKDWTNGEHGFTPTYIEVAKALLAEMRQP